MTDRYRLYGAEFSLYSGKARSYLRKKNIPFDEITATVKQYKKFIVPRTGVRYIPVVQTPDDHVLQDTTVIIDELEKRFSDHSVYPNTPKQRLVSLLLEVYGDEWLVIPAMHYRWNYPATNADFIHQEFGSLVAPNAPAFIQRFLGKKLGSKFSAMVPKLGVHEHNITAIEHSYVELLSDLQAHFEQHPFLLGDKPCIADFGFIGPLYAHLFRDPAPGKLMRAKAPAVCAWVGRMTNDSPALCRGEWLENDEIPETLLPILKRMAREQLPVLANTNQRLDEWRADNPNTAEVSRLLGSHQFSIGGIQSERAIQPYCLWMFQRPVDYYQSLSADLLENHSVNALLSQTGFADALSAGLSNRLVRKDNKLQFA